MAAPRDNKNAVGNRGGGRKSAYQEKADANLLHQLFFDKFNKDQIKKKLSRGRYSLKDVLLSKALDGNDRILIELFKKIFPDKNVVLPMGRFATEPLSDEETERLMKVFAIVDESKEPKVRV